MLHNRNSSNPQIDTKFVSHCLNNVYMRLCRFEHVPLVTPNGDVLVKELNFEVSCKWCVSGINDLNIFMFPKHWLFHGFSFVEVLCTKLQGLLHLPLLLVHFRCLQGKMSWCVDQMDVARVHCSESLER